MNLLLISPDFNLSSGVTRYILILIQILSKHNDIELHLIVNNGNAIPLLKKYKGLKFTLYPFSNSKFSFIKHFDFYFYLIKYCKENSIDIIHTHHRYPEFISYLVSKFLKIKTVTTAHSFVEGMKTISFRSDIILAVSDAVKKYINYNYPNTTAKTYRIYNCVNREYYENNFDNKEEVVPLNSDYLNDKIVFLYAGRITFEKGIDLLLSAFSKLKNEFANIVLILVGDLNDDILIKNFFNRIDIQIFTAKQNIAEFFRRSDFIVLPTRADSLPYTMLEAGLFKKPFIGANIGGIAEFIEDGVTGLLFQNNNSEDLLSKMKYALNHSTDMAMMANRLNEKIQMECDANFFYNSLINYYNLLLTNK